MNINIYVEDHFGKELQRLARRKNKSRNSLVREAIREYVQKEQASSGWPESVRSLFGADPDMIPFESYRSELPPPRENIFGDDDEYNEAGGENP